MDGRTDGFCRNKSIFLFVSAKSWAARTNRTAFSIPSHPSVLPIKLTPKNSNIPITINRRKRSAKLPPSSSSRRRHRAPSPRTASWGGGVSRIDGRGVTRPTPRSPSALAVHHAPSLTGVRHWRKTATDTCTKQNFLHRQWKYRHTTYI
ncbi:hypothetical protein CDEST_12051 [Colletotrichum destructivum]|uniref:Uncharacterized protein n=1 Tax=Colletotrichum destructivum TaxID=34406 RepID=A0AAX4IUY8_9PEZI|nr:hypothetical protein CDEST_12051 [Colletotrichum destructivum]